LLQIRGFADDCAGPWGTHHRFAVRSLNYLIRITNFVLARFHAGACSGTGKQGQASLSAYSASKFGIRALTQCAGTSDPLLRCCDCSHAESRVSRQIQLWNSARTVLPSTLTLLDLSRLQCVRIVLVIQGHVSESYQGMTSNPSLVLSQEYSKIRYA
jgi:hypothetical protein